MSLLAIDTSMAACSVALCGGDGMGVIAARHEEMERGHAEALAPMVREVMAAAAAQPRDLSRIVVTVGPGTFTGVRIGLSFARGLGLALGLPVIGIDSLHAIACNDADAATDRLVAAHARNGEVYAGLFAADGGVLHPPCVVKLADAASLSARPCQVLGTAADALLETAHRSDLVRSRAGDLPCAARFGPLGARLPATGTMPGPLYLRAPDAKPQASPRPPGAPIQFVTAAGEASEVLAALHARCFERPWPAAEFAQLLQSPGTAATIALRAGEPRGFLVTRQAADEAEVLTIGVAPDARRHGVARALMQHGFAALAAQGVATAFIEVARSNLAARALYRSLGFEEAGLRRGYYERADHAREDAIVMRRALP